MLQLSRQFLKIIIALSIVFIIASAVVYFFLAPKLPDTQTLKETQLQIPLRIFSSEGLLMAEFGEKRRIPVDYQDIPQPMIEAFLAAEDDRFYQHPGVDYQGILRAVYSLLTTGSKTQGGSTITMQVARNFFLSNEKTYLRKINEIILALEMEQVLSKEEILTLYLNKIYLGNRAYGVGAAANVYYGRPLSELTLAEMAMIAGLPKAPSKFNPIINPERAMIRRNYVLHRMWEVGYINEKQYAEARQAPVSAIYHGPEIKVYAPYVAEMVRTKLFEDFGEEAYTNGFNVYTTIRAEHQRTANQSLQTALLAYDRRHGYRGPVENIKVTENSNEEILEDLLGGFDAIGPLKPAVVTDVSQDSASVYIKKHGFATLSLASMKWAQKQLSTNSRGAVPKQAADVVKIGDVIRVEKLTADDWQLAQLPQAEGALIAVAPYDGAVTALNGGFEFFQNKFNRVTQSRRQPGSGFKPFIYSAALEKGYTPASVINDAPVVFDDPGLENVWRPENYSGQFYGPTRLREALIHSRNLVSIRLLRDIGAKYAIDYAQKFGFDPNQLHGNLSLALGSGSAAPWDMARAYSALANGGYRIEPYLVQRVEDANGNTLIQAQPDTVCETCLPPDEVDLDSAAFKPAQRIMTPQNNYIMNSLLRDVVKYGTGRKAMSLGRNDLAGKTGTTNDQVDAWFNGFHPELVAISWVGFDNPRTLGHYETGGRAALPMWIDFMKVVLKGLPDESLEPPVDMVTVRIDPATGLLARPEAVDAIYETFRQEDVPTEMAPAAGQGYAGDSGTAPAIDLF
jgi:penicillin-binding protein 1A